MTKTMQNPIDCTSGDQNDWSLPSLEIEAKLEELDRQAGRAYLPMDVFVDRRTMNEHFQNSAIRDRWSRIHQLAA